MSAERGRHGAGVLMLLAALLAPRAAHGQDSVIVIDPDAPAPSEVASGLPPEILAEILATWNDPLVLRLPGGLVVPTGSGLEGPVASFRGTLRVAGRVSGRLTVINGDLVIEPGGTVTGDVLVAGGRMSVQPGGVHDGAARVYWDAAPLLRQGDGSLVLRERRRPIGELATAERTFRKGDLDYTLRLTTGQTYNRIEGLPIVFGPLFTWRASRRLTATLDARGILRTAPDDTPFRRDLGWLVRTDWRVGGPGGFGLGGRTYSVVAGIEEHALPRDEVGWNSFLLQRDYRDYYYSEGVGGNAYAFVGRRVRLDASVRYEKQGSLRANDPWSLFRHDSPWRPNPLVDDGHFTIAALGFEVDSRNSRSEPSSGWWLRGAVEHSTSDDVAPVALPTTVRAPLPTSGYGYSRFTLDARRYNRLSPEMRVNLRLWAGGWLAGDPLPVQRRLSLGGLDLLPGYPFRALTCAPAGFADPSHPALCDRALMTQAEVRHRLGLRLGTTVRDRDRREFDRFLGIRDPDLVLLADAGTAWLAGIGPSRVPSDRIPSLDTWKVDAGIGLDAGDVSVYLVKALTDGEPVRVYLRLARRF